MKKLKCYLAHPLKERSSNKKYRIRKELLERGIEVIDPFIGEFKILRKYGITVEQFYNVVYLQIPDPPHTNQIYDIGREIWIKDLQQIRNCNMMVVWFPKNHSVGCSAELQHAYHFGKFIQIISYLRHPSFAYVLTGANQQFETVKDWENMREMRW